jgi:hypothetical protein
MSDEQDDSKKQVEKPASKKSPEKKKFVPKPMPHKAIKERIRQKWILVLVFLAGEVWSSMKILSYILKLGVRQTQKTLADMVLEKILKYEVLPGGERIYGITEKGLAYINCDVDCRAFELGKTPKDTVDHHLLSQKIRIELTRHGATDWVPGKALYKRRLFKRVPDGVFTYCTYVVATETELHVKTEKRMKEILNDYVEDLRQIDNGKAYLHKIIYFTPFPVRIQKFIDDLVPGELKGRFLVIFLDCDIRPFLPNELYFFDKKIMEFLDRDCSK